MALFKSLTDILYERINAENVLPEPVTPANAPIVLYTHGANGASVAQLKGVRYSGWSNYVDLKYTRINLATLFLNVLPRVETGYGIKARDIIGQVSSALGLNLIATDVVDHPISWNDPEDDQVYTCKIEMVPNHPLFYGFFIVEIAGMTPSLETMVGVRDMDGLKDTSPHEGYTNSTIITYGTDYSAIGAWLKANIAIKTDNVATVMPMPLLRELAEQLKSVDGRPWMYSHANTHFNLAAAKIYHHMAVKDSTMPLIQKTGYGTAPHGDFDNYILIIPSKTYWYGYKLTDPGLWGIYIHYNSIDDVGEL